MSPSALDTAEAQWQAQLAIMRAAIAELPKPIYGEGRLYGADMDFEDDEDIFNGKPGDDVWDFISDVDDEFYSSEPSEDTPVTSNDEEHSYGPAWLKAKCSYIASRKQALSASELESQIQALLVSDSQEDELQSTLTDILGFDDLDFVIELISHRKDIITQKPLSGIEQNHLAGKLQTKGQREEALRQRDYEHKHTSLRPKVDRHGEQYPHVYKSHSAGNILDSKGQKYGLPVGNERKQHEVSICS